MKSRWLGEGIKWGDVPTDIRLIEKLQTAFVQATFDIELADVLVRRLQRHIGSIWIEAAVSRLRCVYGLERLPKFDSQKSYLCVSNHRSFFDMYVITAFLVYRDLIRHRLLFPVRSRFFYDDPLGFLINGWVSFFAMYPPIFRGKMKTNVWSLKEVSRLIKKGGMFVGVHPEGRRHVGPDPYTLLDAKYGVGKIVYDTHVEVIPVFINGLSNDVYQQIRQNFRPEISPQSSVNVVFGQAINFAESGLLSKDPTYATYQKIASHCLSAVAHLGEEERLIRYS